MGSIINGRCCGRNWWFNSLINNTTLAPQGPLVITYANFDVLPFGITDIESLSEWNAKIAGITGASNYTSIVVDYVNFTITLDGGSNVIIGGNAQFGQDSELVSVVDQGSSVVEVLQGAFHGGGPAQPFFALVDLPYVITINTSFTACNATEIRLDRCTKGGQNEFFSSVTSIFYLPELTTIGDKSWENNSVMTSIDLPKLNVVPPSCFKNCTSLVSANIPVCTEVQTEGFSTCAAMTTLTAPLLQYIRIGGFAACNSLDNVILPALLDMEAAAFSECFALVTYSMPLVQAIGNSCFLNCTSLVVADFPSATIIGQNAFSGCSALTTVDCPNVSIVQSFAFSTAVNITSINLPLCTDLGGTTGDDQVFDFIIGNTISATFNSTLATNNGGNPDGDIQYLEANNTCTINYV